MTRDWIIDGFDKKEWKQIKKIIKNREFADGEFFGCIMCGALCFDIIMHDMDMDDDGKCSNYKLFADAYLLGIDSGYGYTYNNETPYDEDDGILLMFDTTKNYEETLQSFLEQIDKRTIENKRWAEFADKTSPLWKDEKGV